MEGEDISPAVANASTLGVNPFFNGETIFNFGAGSSVEGDTTENPTNSSDATATATSAPNSPASAETVSSIAPGSAASQSAASSSDLDTILIVVGIAISGLALFFALRKN